MSKYLKLSAKSVLNSEICDVLYSCMGKQVEPSIALNYVRCSQ